MIDEINILMEYMNLLLRLKNHGFNVNNDINAVKFKLNNLLSLPNHQSDQRQPKSGVE